jgi:hypothetical protein
MQLSVCNSRPPGSTHHTQGTISQVKSSTTLNRQHPHNNNAVHVSYLEKKKKKSLVCFEKIYDDQASINIDSYRL